MEIYEKLWQEAIAAFRQDGPKIDRHLTNKATDLRRGVTLVCRPSAAVKQAVMDYLQEIQSFCPGQYCYRPEEMHVTVLSIITMTESWREEMDWFEVCRPLIREVLERQRSFKIQFRGVTAAPDSVMVQGFPLGEGLTVIRDALRKVLARAGFGDMLDRRYKVTAAHISIMRFSQPCPEIERLLAFLKQSRDRSFGECEMTRLELIWGNWYASHETVKTLEEYPLRGK